MPETKSRFYKGLSSLESLLPYWRAATIVVLIIAVFTPWVLGPGEIGSIGNANPILYPGWFILILFILYPPLLIGLLLYLILSLVKFIKSSSWLKYLLPVVAGINFLSFGWLGWQLFSEGLLWGYWLGWVGILSGFILETVDMNLLIDKEKNNSVNHILT